MPPTECPKCHADLRYGISDIKDNGEFEYFSRVISIYDRDKDRTTHWRCPDCGRGRN
jgi:rubredoxin